MPADQVYSGTTRHLDAVVELGTESVAAVAGGLAGGLNPRSLPPRFERFYWQVATGAVVTAVPENGLKMIFPAA